MADQIKLMVSPTSKPSWVPGTIEITATCGHQAWLSPSGLQLTLEHPEAETICQNCVDPGEVDVVHTHQAGMAELTALIGFEAADALVKEVQADPAKALRELQGHNED